NYGPELPDGSTPTNMTPDDVRAMFGDGVCAGTNGGKCDLIPEAQAWVDEVNRDMAAGHCYGFSVAAELLWQRRLNVAAYGAPAIAALDVEDSTRLQRLIASGWAMQLLDSVRSNAVAGTPNEIVARLR